MTAMLTWRPFADLRWRVITHEDRVVRCGRKQRHTSQEAARAQIRGIVEDGASPAPHRLRAYRCPYCGFWHVGHFAEARHP